jgi:hypothetical protein
LVSASVLGRGGKSLLASRHLLAVFWDLTGVLPNVRERIEALGAPLYAQLKTYGKGQGQIPPGAAFLSKMICMSKRSDLR